MPRAAATFSPELPPVTTEPRPVMLGRFVPTALRRVSPVAKIQRPARVLLLGLLSGGVIPLLQLRERWVRVTNLQRQQFELAAELLNCHVDAPEVTEAAKAIKPSKTLTTLAGVAALVAMIAALVALTGFGWTLTGLRTLYIEWPQSTIVLTWIIAVSAGYLIVWWQINQHVQQQQAFALAFNATTEGKTPPLQLPPLVWGVRSVYVLIAVVMALVWMVWGLPMMLAWAAFATFNRRTDPHFRTQLARALESISGVEPVVPDADACANPDCRGPIPETAMYCPRCGRPAGHRGRTH